MAALTERKMKIVRILVETAPDAAFEPATEFKRVR